MRTWQPTAAAVLTLILTCSSGSGAPYDGRSLPQKARIDRLVLYKARHRLEAWAGKRLLKTYSVSIGKGGAGPKRHEGDDRTPEGTYRIDRRYHSKTYHRFLHISYPNERDRAAYAKLRKQGRIPKGKGIGGAIGIHGEKKGFRLLPHKWIDWTRGCVAVDDEESEELYRAVVRRAVVLIHP